MWEGQACVRGREAYGGGKGVLAPVDIVIFL